MKKHFAKKSFGQNFLADENVIRKIVSVVDPQYGETIIEIGPGRGALTESFIDSGARVIAVEVERDVIEILRTRFSGSSNLHLIDADVLKVDFRKLFAELFVRPKVKLAANLPYYISTAILQKLIGERSLFSELVLMFQREVAERITAAPSSKNRGFLTVMMEAYFECERLFDVSPRSFQPAPKVWSSIVRLRPKAATPEITDETIFREFVSAAFAQKRKTLANNLKNAGEPLFKMLESIGGIDELFRVSQIDPQRRAESLSNQEWLLLVKNIKG